MSDEKELLNEIAMARDICEKVESMKRYITEKVTNMDETSLKVLELMYTKLEGMIKILDIHIQFIKDMSYINMKLIEDVPNKKEYYKNNLEFMYTNMVKISNTAEQTQFTLEETKKTAAELFISQKKLIQESLPVVMRELTNRVINRERSRLGASSRAVDWTDLMLEAKDIIDHYRQHNRRTRGPKKTITDVYRELKARCENNPDLDKVPCLQYFRKLIKAHDLSL